MAQIPREQVVKIRAELGNAVVVRPGDKLVLAYADSLSADTARAIKERVAELLPGVEAVLIDGPVSVTVYRDEPTGIRHVDGPLTRETAAKARQEIVMEIRDDAPADDAVKAYIRRNPEWFRQWVAKQNRISGARPLRR